MDFLGETLEETGQFVDVCLLVECGVAELGVEVDDGEQVEGFGDGIKEESLIKPCPKVQHQHFGVWEQLLCTHNYRFGQIGNKVILKKYSKSDLLCPQLEKFN